MRELPFIDEHGLRIDAEAEAVWSSLLATLSSRLTGAERFAHVLGCDPSEGTTTFSGAVGDALPGFRVSASDHGRRLVLRGRHRFAEYALTFIIDGGYLRAQTHAAFPGVRGRLYRAAVIGSGGHTLVTRRMLHDVARATREAASSGSRNGV